MPGKSMSKSGHILLPVHYFFCLFNKNAKYCKNKAVFHFFTECVDELFYKITEWCIICGAIKITEKNCSNLPNNA